jgi:hypothetical protein
MENRRLIPVKDNCIFHLPALDCSFRRSKPVTLHQANFWTGPMNLAHSTIFVIGVLGVMSILASSFESPLIADICASACWPARTVPAESFSTIFRRHVSMAVWR